MKDAENHFEYWRRLSAESTDRLADRFYGHFQSLSTNEQRALFAAFPERDRIRQRTRSALKNPEAPLGGVPYLLQDLFDVADLSTRCGAPFAAPFDFAVETSCALQQTLEALGAILLAKNVPGEFGITKDGHNRTFGSCPHPTDPRLLAGGAAGSSAFCIKKGWAPLAFGLDSIAGLRIPAAFQGLFGFRMERKVLVTDGVLPTFPSLESIGWLTHTLEDLETTFQAFYPLSEKSTSKATLKGFLMRNPGPILDTEISAGMSHLAHSLDLDESPETANWLAQNFAGCKQALDRLHTRELYFIHRHWLEEYREFYDERLLKKIDFGKQCGVAELDRATDQQQNLSECLAQFFEDYDYLVMPVCHLPSPDISIWSDAFEDNLDRLNAPLSLAGLPAAILPFACSAGRSGAVQLITHPRKLHCFPRIFQRLNKTNPYKPTEYP